MLRWYDTKARPWSSWPSPSKPREKLKPLRRMTWSAVVGGAGVGQADVGVERRDVAVGVGGEVGEVGLALAVERRAVGLAPADQRLLLAEAGAVPELDQHPDDPDHVVACRPPPRPARRRRSADPHASRPSGRHRSRVEVGGAVDEAHQVADAGLARLGLDPPVVALEHPVQGQAAPGWPA